MLRPDVSARLRGAAAAAFRRARTPFYLFDGAELERRALSWNEAAAGEGGPVSLAYPYKCNRYPPLLDLLAREKIGAEVACLVDLRAAAERGIRGANLVVQGPAKGSDLLDAGLDAGALFVADGREDAEAILARASETGTTPRYLIRLDPVAAEPPQRGFGLAARDLLELARRIRRAGGPRPEGLAFHLGTGIPGSTPYLRAIREAAEVSAALAAEGSPVRRLDLGGGFAASGESRLDANGRPRRKPKPASEILSRLATEARRRIGPSVRLHVEPGRALVSESFHLVARVVRVKRDATGTRAFLDASRIAHAYFVALGLHPAGAIPRRPGGGRVLLAGPLGIELDHFGPVRLGPIRPGDLIVIASVGAYNWNTANAWPGFLPTVVPIPAGRARR